MNKPMRKDLRRSIRRNKIQFFSILITIALGVSFFVGVKSTAPDFEQTVTEYSLRNNLMDLSASSPIGLTDDDIEAISEVKYVESVSPKKYVDVLLKSNNNTLIGKDSTALVCRVLSMNFDDADKFSKTGEADSSYINRTDLIKGRYPQNNNECVIDANAAENYSELSVGKTITLSEDNGTIDDIISVKTYKIVGTVTSPVYISTDRGTTKTGAGTLGLYLYTSADNFKSKYYSTAYITLQYKKDYTIFSDEYKDYVNQVKADVLKISAKRINDRTDSAKKEYSNNIAESKKELKTAQKASDSQLIDLQADIDVVQADVDSGSKNIEKETKALNNSIDSKNNSLKKQKEAYDNSLKDYNTKQAQYNAVVSKIDGYSQTKNLYDDLYNSHSADEATLNSYKDDYTQIYSDLTDKKQELQQLKSQISDTEKEISDEENRINSITTALEGETQETVDTSKLDKYKQTLKELNNQLSDAEIEISSLSSEYNQSVSKYNIFKENYDTDSKTLKKYQATLNKLTSGEKSLAKTQDELDKQKKSLDKTAAAITEKQLDIFIENTQGKRRINEETINFKAISAKLSKLNSNYEKTEHSWSIKIQNIQGDIDNSTEILNNLEKMTWETQTIHDLSGYAGFIKNIRSIYAFADVFPAFFFLVAIFICLASMTRMIEEERMRLGTLKSMGYSNNRIAQKYFSYVLFATMSGAVLGSVFGTYVIPYAFYYAYSMAFNLPLMHATVRWAYIIFGIVISFITSVFVTAVACSTELKQEAALLMRPREIKNGTRLFIERFAYLRNGLSINTVITLRNMMRSKKRIIMTVIGIAGCTALILSSLGLKNSVNAIAGKQFGENGITQYDIEITLDQAQDPLESSVLNNVKDNIKIDKAMLIYTQLYSAGSEKVKEYANLIVPESSSQINDFINLKVKNKKQTLQLDDSGVIITEKFAEDCNLNIGSKIIFDGDNEKKYELKVSAISENYVGHYIYISPTLYAETFGDEIGYNTIICKTKGFTTEGDRKNFADDILGLTGISGVKTKETQLDAFSDQIDRMNYIILIFILAAALLAFLVLYNLTHISVHERLKEIAALKAFGMTDNEVTSYVYRENIFMMIIGVVIGTLLGIFLHIKIVGVVEINTMMLGHTISWWSYLLTYAIISLSAFVASLLVHVHLKNLNVLDALKTIE